MLSRVLGTTAFAAKISSLFLPLPQWIKFRLWYLQTSKFITVTSTLLYKTILNTKNEVAKTKVHTGSSCAVRAEQEGPGLTSVGPRRDLGPTCPHLEPRPAGRGGTEGQACSTHTPTASSPGAQWTARGSLYRPAPP